VASASLGGAIIGPELEGRASRHATFTRQELFTLRFTKNNEIVQEQAIFSVPQPHLEFGKDKQYYCIVVANVSPEKWHCGGCLCLDRPMTFFF
jgi:hypothetical protein